MKCQAILVNYRGAQLICAATESLINDSACDEIHVVDNSVCSKESAWLEENLDPRVRLTVSPQNIGFARACNLAFAASSADCVLLLNPDARLFPGALQRLKDTLAEQPGTGAVGPRVFWDAGRKFLIPPSTYPSRRGYFLDRLGECCPAVANDRAERFRRQSISEWRLAMPFRVNALSGGLVLLRRQSLTLAGGLFDPRFFMYWEDSDLMWRLRKIGQRLLLDPRAEAVHLYEHSPSKDQMIADGWVAFAEKYFSSGLWRLIDRLSARCRKPRPASPMTPIDHTSSTADIKIQIPDQMAPGWIMEFSPSPNFVSSVGHFGYGKIACLPYELANRFEGREYYLRLGTPDSLEHALTFSVRTS